MIDHTGAQTPTRNQGDRQTCVGFAVSGAHEWMAGDGAVRSPEDAIWAGHQQGGPPDREDTSVALALGGLESHQHASEEAWPYGTPPWPADRPAAATQSTNQRALPRWRPLPAVTLAGCEIELAQGLAVILTISVVRAAWQDASGQIDAEAGRKAPRNHAVLAVGVLVDAAGAAERVVIKNSWGPHWGDGGYGFVSRRYLETYGIRAHVLEASR